MSTIFININFSHFDKRLAGTSTRWQCPTAGSIKGILDGELHMISSY